MLDLDAYFRRIAHTGPRAPSVDALTTIVADTPVPVSARATAPDRRALG